MEVQHQPGNNGVATRRVPWSGDGEFEVHMSDELQRYMLALVRATRNLATSQPAARDLAEGQGAKKHVPLSTLSFGASPRATE